MIIGKYIPDNAIQIRYVHPQYEQDEDGNEYIWNEDEMTDVSDLICQVNRTKQPVYYRRRYTGYARDDSRKWNAYVNNHNRSEKHVADDDDDFGGDYLYVRVKKVGRRVLIVYDKDYWIKVLQSNKKITRNLGMVTQIKTTSYMRQREQLARERRDEENHRIQTAIDSMMSEHEIPDWYTEWERQREEEELDDEDN